MQTAHHAQKPICFSHKWQHRRKFDKLSEPYSPVTKQSKLQPPVITTQLFSKKCAAMRYSKPCRNVFHMLQFKMKCNTGCCHFSCISHLHYYGHRNSGCKAENKSCQVQAAHDTMANILTISTLPFSFTCPRWIVSQSRQLVSEYGTCTKDCISRKNCFPDGSFCSGRETTNIPGHDVQTVTN